ncbi:hypothetical protein [Streptomyces sp. PRh5]|uniref:hypothetical protein n=1 Tax=Streptomyces sp. PRh5 TaxID=1158056 RepID=UPI0012FEF11B|nr:hypothetical protein [Streptomyces sp. PRh5]
MQQPTCIVKACQDPTDTVLHFEGNGQWLVACLIHLGIEKNEAIFMISKFLDCAPDPDEVFDKEPDEGLTLFICPKCASEAKFPPPANAGMPVPVIAQHG